MPIGIKLDKWREELSPNQNNAKELLSFMELSSDKR